MLTLLLGWLALAAPPALRLGVAPVDVPAVIEIPVDSLVWVDAHHPMGAPEAVAEVLGDDMARCPDLRSSLGFRPRGAEDLWERELLRYAVVEVTAEGIAVSGRTVMPLEGGDTPERLKEGLVLTPLLDTLLAHREVLFQFRGACGDPAWEKGGAPTAASGERLLLAVAPDVPFDVVYEVLFTARKARFKHFYLYARSRRVVPDPLNDPPSVGDASVRVFVASDGGLGIDYEEEGQDSPQELLTYLPRPAASRSARVVPYPVSPFARVAGAAGALLAQGFEPAVLPRLDRDDLRASRVAPVPQAVVRTVSGTRSVQAVPITIPEGTAEERRTAGNVTRFSITGSTPHVAVFTPPAHLADALNTPEVGSRLKHVLTCYRDEESDNTGLQGMLALEVRVKPDGTAEKVAILPTSDLDDPHVRRCVVDEFAALRFPQAAITPDPMLWKVLFLPRPPGTPAPDASEGDTSDGGG
jgi:hypothetical protein